MHTVQRDHIVYIIPRHTALEKEVVQLRLRAEKAEEQVVCLTDRLRSSEATNLELQQVVADNVIKLEGEVDCLKRQLNNAFDDKVRIEALQSF